jgi:hypothetical protein
VGAVLIHADGRTDGHDEAGSVIVKRKGLLHSKVCCEIAKKIFVMLLKHTEEECMMRNSIILLCRNDY